jgi:uncharacterized short protein YbdD (DUF466 family)
MRETERGNGKGEQGKVGAAARTFPLSHFPFPRFRALASTAKQVFGMPDYDRYLAHHRAGHCGEPVLSRKEHYLQFIQRRYASGGSRCC